ncbi:unnamed protein product [Mytilus coruscus]|uniref:Uncharacterized protein n=1 Tax=Mytilus coruscus TaxID=42192 RepID=A0A6J8APM5_MYTCO|nr:unnamed protein product [Mytilus coruscus]
MFLKTIPHFKDLVFIKENNEILLPLVDFVKFLKENRKPDDTPSRTDNIHRDFDKKGGIQKLGDKVYITLQILISYVISKTTSVAICKDIYKDILKLIIAEKNYSDDIYTKKLYDDIAVFSSCNKHINATEILEFNESQIYTLNSNYKHFFTDTEWKFICQFEDYFQQQYPDFADYSETLTRKCNLFAKIKKAYEIGSQLSKYTKEYTLRSQRRREFSDILYDNSFVVNETFHIYTALKSCILNAVSGFFHDIEEIVCVECSPESCAHVFTGVHIYIELSKLENTDEELRDL